MKATEINWAEMKKRFGSALEIEKITGIKYQTIVYHFKKNGLALSEKAAHRQLATSITQEELERKYVEFGSAELTGNFFGISKAQVLRRLSDELKDENICAKYFCNEDFFKQDTEASMYMAGFLAADGCLFKKDGRYKQVSLSLKSDDVEILEKMKQLLKFEGPISRWTSKSSNPKWKDCDKAGFCISSDELFDSLIDRFCLGERKSLTLKFPERLIDHPLVHHFLRGYWDGDGTIYCNKITKSQGAVATAFCGIRGTPEFLMTARQILERETSVRKRGSKPIRISSEHGILEYGGNVVVASIRDFLYKNATIFLSRKHKKFSADFIGGVAARSGLMKEELVRSVPIEAVEIETGARTLFLNVSEIFKNRRFSKTMVYACLNGKKSSHDGHTFRRLPKGSFPSTTERVVKLQQNQPITNY